MKKKGVKRRDFLKMTAGGAIGAGILSGMGASASPEASQPNRSMDQWYQLGKGTKGLPERKKNWRYDVAVIGGGLAGICAAVSAARNGAKTVLVQDRPMLGGNASSEIQVIVHGVTNLDPDRRAERETGLIEEILLDNRFLNPQESYTVWDHVLYNFVVQESNIDLMLNTQATKAVMSGSKIQAAECWQLTTETEFVIQAELFIDCSGDGLLAATAGALYRTGREASSEFNEKYAPKVADGWQMGASILLQAKDMGKPMPYEAPSFAIKYNPEKERGRKIKQFAEGYWWIELGSEFDIIAEQEINRHKLMGYLHGVWDYIKNSGKYPESQNYALQWVGSLPGRRESRRFIGDYILSERDLLEYRHFPDAVAYGGWCLDEHCPGGIENLKEPASYFHENFSKVYEIPFRSLYSKNISNLLFAGRNISQTHIALSSSRVMATCSLMGQAVGTAAALCNKKGISPRLLAQDHISQLQEKLLCQDSFIPNRPANDEHDLTGKADVIMAWSTLSGDSELLRDGVSRDENGQIHHWQSDGLPAKVQIEWIEPVLLSVVEIKCDTNVHRTFTMRKDAREDHKFIRTVPPEMLKTVEIQARINGKWKKLGFIQNNRRRLIKFQFDQVKTTAVLLRMIDTYGAKNAKLFEVRCYETV